MSQMLTYPGFSVVFIQTFSVHHTKEFVLPKNAPVHGNVRRYSLHNLADYKAMRSEFLLNIILAIISVASTFELFFQESEMPFLAYFGLETSKLAAVVVLIVAMVTMFALLLVVTNSIKSVWERLKTLFRN